MASLPISVETNQLAGLEKALNGIVKVVGKLADASPGITKALDRINNSSKNLAKTQSDTGVQVDKVTRILERQKGILAEMSRDYTRGEASTLEYAKAAGATKTQLKELEATLKSIRTVMGTDPFDNSIGAIRKYQTENKVLAETFKNLKKGIELSNSEIRDLIRVKEQAAEAARREGVAEKMTLSSIRGLVKLRVKEATDAYKEEIALNRQLVKQIKDYQDNLKRAAAVQKGFNNVAKSIVAQGLDKSFATLSNISKGLSTAFENLDRAGKKVDNTLARIEAQARGMREGLTKEASAGLFAFEQAARATGKSEQEVQILIARYKALQVEMTEISAKNRRLGSSFLGLQGIIRAAFPAAGAIGFGVALVSTAASVVQTSDALTLLSNRLSVATGGAADFNTEFENILRIANESRTSVQDVGTLYARLIPVVDKLGGSTAEAAAITESFSKLLLLGGSNTREASAAIVQFSQALGKGKLDGDEFRSIAEATPEVLRLLEDSLGKTRGELMKMSEEGQLTADVLGNTLINALDSLDARLVGIPLTVGQAYQVLKNNLTDSVRLFEESTNTVGSLSSAIQSLATFVYDVNRAFKDGEYNEVLNVLGDLTVWFGSVALSVGIARTATAGLEAAYKLYTKSAGAAVFITQALNTVLGMNPAIRAVTIIASLAGAIFLLKDRTFELNGSLVDLQSLFTAVFEGFGSLFAGIGEIVTPAIEGIKSYYDFVIFGATEVFDFIKNWNNGLIGIFVGIGEVGSLIWNGFKDAAKSAFDDVGSLISAFFTDLMSGDFNFTTFNQQLSNSFTKSFGLAQQAVTTFSNAYKKDYIGALTEDIKLRAEGIVIRAEEIKQQKVYENMLEDLADQNERIAAEEDERAKRKKELATLIAQTSNEESDSTNKTRKEILRLVEAENLRSQEIRLQFELGRKLTDTEKERLELTRKYGQAIAENILAQRQLNDADQAALDLIEEYNKQQKDKIDSHIENIKNLQDEISKLEDELRLVGKSSAAIREYELSKKRAALADLVVPEDIARLEEEIKLLEKRNRLKDDIENQEKILKVAEDTKKEFEKIQDDIAKSITDAIAGGGQKGKDILKNMFKAQVFRIFIEPTVRNIAGSIAGALGVPGASGGFDFASLAGIASTVASGGIEGLTLQKGLENIALNPQVLEKIGNSIFFSTNGALADVGRSLATNASSLSSLAGEIAPYAGSIVSVLQGNVTGGLGSAAGTYIGGAFGGPIGAAIGSFIGGKIFGGLGGSGKISASNLSPALLKPITDETKKSFDDIVASLGGVARGIEFYIGGNTGRQGQNPNFNLGAVQNGRQIFNSNQTAEGQFDGLFQLGEIALNDANIADQTTRAIVAALQKSDFQDNIDEVFKSVNPFTDSLERLNTALSDAKLLKTINDEFPKLGGALATLANQSIETVKSFVLLSGGIQNLQNLQSGYISSIYSEEEKLALATDNLNKAFAALGLSVPESTSDYKKLVEAQNLSTVEGQATYLALLGLSSAFVEVKDQTEALKNAELESQKEQQEAIEKTIELQKQLSESMLETANNIRQTINDILFDDATPVNQLASLQQEFEKAVSSALSSEGQALIEAGNSVNSLISEVLGSASEIYASGPEYQRLRDLVFSQAGLVAERLEDLAPLTYQQETISLLQTISSASVLTAQLLGAEQGISLTPSFSGTVQTADIPSLTTANLNTLPVQQNNVDLSSVVAELRALRQDVVESGEISIKVVTESGEVITEQTLKQIKDRSRRGELVVYASGVK